MTHLSTPPEMPMLSQDRMDQMIQLAMSQPQDARIPTWTERLAQSWQHHSRRITYGVGATAVSFSCIAAFWVVPFFNVKPEPAVADVNISEYLLQDLLEDLS